MKMHKIMFLTAAALLFLMPPVNAQDEDSAESGGGAEAGEEKTAEDGKTDKADGEAAGDKGEKGKSGEAPEKKTLFSDHQKRIKDLRDKKQKLESAGRRRDAGKIADTLKQEQKRMKSLFDKEAEKIKTEIQHLKEQSKRSSSAMKGKLNEDLKKQEEALKQLEADADIKTWCTEPKEKEPVREKEKSKSSTKKQKKNKITSRKSKKKKK